MKLVTNSAVLFADDDRNDRELFRMATQDAKWPNRVVGFEDGEHLVRYLNGGVEPPALIILDLNMTNLGGIGVLYWLRARRDLDSVPAIILSSSSQERDIREAIALGATEYCVKPLNYADLVQLTRELRTRWLEPGLDRKRPVSRFEWIRRGLLGHADGISAQIQRRAGTRHVRAAAHA
jgi:DNA-binding response OmpR family regulator